MWALLHQYIGALRYACKLTNAPVYWRFLSIVLKRGVCISRVRNSGTSMHYIHHTHALLTLYARCTCAQIDLVATRQDIEKMAILYYDDS